MRTCRSHPSQRRRRMFAPCAITVPRQIAGSFSHHSRATPDASDMGKGGGTSVIGLLRAVPGDGACLLRHRRLTRAASFGSSFRRWVRRGRARSYLARRREVVLSRRCRRDSLHSGLRSATNSSLCACPPSVQRWHEAIHPYARNGCAKGGASFRTPRGRPPQGTNVPTSSSRGSCSRTTAPERQSDTARRLFLETCATNTECQPHRGIFRPRRGTERSAATVSGPFLPGEMVAK